MALLVNHRLISFSLRPKNISLIENLKLWGHSIINLEQNDQKSDPLLSPPPPPLVYASSILVTYPPPPANAQNFKSNPHQPLTKAVNYMIL